MNTAVRSLEYELTYDHDAARPNTAARCSRVWLINPKLGQNMLERG
jgi:hypothetical protein